MMSDLCYSIFYRKVHGTVISVCGRGCFLLFCDFSISNWQISMIINCGGDSIQRSRLAWQRAATMICSPQKLLYKPSPAALLPPHTSGRVQKIHPTTHGALDASRDSSASGVGSHAGGGAADGGGTVVRQCGDVPGAVHAVRTRHDASAIARVLQRRAEPERGCTDEDRPADGLHLPQEHRRHHQRHQTQHRQRHPCQVRRQSPLPHLHLRRLLQGELRI